jgi:hypothetical protein
MHKFKIGDFVKRPLYINNQWEMRVFIIEDIIGFPNSYLGYSCRDVQSNHIHNFWTDDYSIRFPELKLRKATKDEAIIYGL